MKRLPAAIAAVGCLLWGATACRPERQSYVPDAGSGDVTPTMTTRDVETFISDSGYTRYHITTPLWLMFEDAEEPFWRFPYGLDMEQYDLQMRPESNVICDSAVYFSRMRLWRLDGNVVMVNTQRDSFLTQQLFWDQNDRKIYSDSFIHIVRSDRIIEGYGFESEQNMNSYIVHRPTAILPVERRRPGAAGTDSTRRDTARSSADSLRDTRPARTLSDANARIDTPDGSAPPSAGTTKRAQPVSGKSILKKKSN